MARIGSRQIAGYYPTPNHLLPPISSVLRWPEPPRRATYLLDPCAGDGEAILTLAKLWSQQWSDAVDEDTYPRPKPPAIVACEMEADRARSLGDALPGFEDTAFHADAFRLTASRDGTDRATVLFLNPPYDHDSEYGRLEHRFLVRFTRMLHPGAGVLLFVVPAAALKASAEHLAGNFLELRAWRFPGEDFDAFGQVLLVGRRVAKPLSDTSYAETLRGWAEDPSKLPELPQICPDPLTLDLEPHPRFSLALRVEELDVTAAVEAFRPLVEEGTGLTHQASDLLGAKFETAAPPKPAHIALALSSGMFNGWPLAANDPQRHPPVLAKGVFERENLIVSEKTNQDGEVTGVVEIEQPRLRLTVLRLDEMTFHELAPGTVPTGSVEVSEWNAADLIANYDRSLAGLLAQQFPALHDPQDPMHRITLPQLARKPYRVQSQAIQTALKLLANGRNPMLVAEVGTGKTTMALMVAAALSPEHYEETVAELQRVGCSGRPPRVEKILAVCPPHLLDTWCEEAAAVVPEWQVQVVRSPEDLDRQARLYILSRETAKLGHARKGIEGQCPRCGSVVRTQPKQNASRRRLCPAVPRRPANEPARLAESLATVLLPSAPDSSLLRTLVRAPALKRHCDRKAEPRPIPTHRLAEVGKTLARAIARLAKQSSPVPPRVYSLTSALVQVASAAGIQRQVLRILQSGQRERGWSRPSWLSSCLASLRESADRGQGPSPELAPLLRAVEGLREAGTWEEGPPCGEPLYQASPQPRRVPLAQVIQRRHRRDFSLVLLDEAHEYAHTSSAQSKAAHRLTGLPGAATVVLTGSLMGGYASSLFTNFWHLSPVFRKEFDRSERSLFLDRYGYRKTLRKPDAEPEDQRRGRYTDRDLDGRRTLGEAPGVMPTFVMRHLLPTAVLVHKDDLDLELPPISEEPALLEADSEDDRDEALLEEYDRIQTKVLDCVRRDRFHPERAGRLLGALVELPSYLDRATDDLPPFEVRYPEALGGELVARAKSFPASWKTPKERWLLSELRRHIEAGQKVLVFLRHTGTPHLPRRLLGLIEEITPRVAWLDASKVTTAKRQDWIDRHVLEAGAQVLLVNPNAVRTGLNNLVTFSTAIWHQLDWSATTYRQANGRLHRIGQTRPVTVRIPIYEGTAQEVGFDLVARKVGASLQVDGLDLQAALEAAGASDDRTTALATAMSLGQAVYKALTGRGPKRRSWKQPTSRSAPHIAANPQPIRRTTGGGTQLSLPSDSNLLGPHAPTR